MSKTIRSFPVTFAMPEEAIEDTIDSAFAGGSRHWVKFGELVRRVDGAESWAEHAMRGGVVRITPLEDSEADGPIYGVNRESIAAGVAALLAFRDGDGYENPYARHFAAMLAGTGDAETGDVLLQFIVLGKVSDVDKAVAVVITLGRVILESMKRPVPGIPAGELYALVMAEGVTLEVFEGALGVLVKNKLVKKTPAGWLTIQVKSGLS